MKYAFINGIILNGTKDMAPENNLTIFTDNGKITDILPSEESTEGYQVIDLKGSYIMPGLINMHVHLAGNGKPQKKQRDNTKLVNQIFSNPVSAKAAESLVGKYAKIELLSGVTTVRTVGGLRDLDTKIRDEINRGKRRGPRILAANEGISVPGGHMAGSVAIAASTINEALAQVHHCKDAGTDLIKLMITGGVLDAREKGVPGELKMKPEMIKAVCDEAHKLGFIVAAHVESPSGLKAALQNGVDSIEHGAKADDEIIQLFKETGAFLTTTLSPALPYALFDRSVSNASEVKQYNGNIVFEGIRDCSVKAIENGIPVALGNDVGCPWISQYDFWRELYYFHKYVGVSNAFALHTATLNNARLAGIGDITGSIEKGKCADMIVTEENPLADLHALRNVSMVVARGEVITHPKTKRKKILDENLDPFC
ncbi:MAG: amidohydrolase family protein [Eubacterium sp.]|jgi:imidazolonepropionase-like amidohydrolase|uniref:amidohydrolase family protein n=1 Tax=Eubacterium sp. F2 TaxID=3381348 RepID=UPI00390821A7|nr:amidohydrolase family protein [Eubacterium sp.]MCI2197685.1 amidohydrolase family protein [Eubacterium sp.]